MLYFGQLFRNEGQIIMQHQLTLGSLFDGIGGFPFAGEIAGIKPVWAAEVEPLCVAVTKRHFPDMLHFGDVSKLNGADLPPVDIITFGSPCQDLSVAGQRKGLKHKKNGDGETTRSGLFFDAVRIIYEMREATNGLYPTFIVWENRPDHRHIRHAQTARRTQFRPRHASECRLR